MLSTKMLLLIPFMISSAFAAPLTSHGQTWPSFCKPNSVGLMECKVPKPANEANAIAKLKASLPDSCTVPNAAFPNKVHCKLPHAPANNIFGKREAAVDVADPDFSYSLSISWKRDLEDAAAMEVAKREAAVEAVDPDFSYTLSISWKRDEDAANMEVAKREDAVEAADPDFSYSLSISWKRDEDQAMAMEKREAAGEAADPDFSYTLSISW